MFQIPQFINNNCWVFGLHLVRKIPVVKIKSLVCVVIRAKRSIRTTPLDDRYTRVRISDGIFITNEKTVILMFDYLIICFVLCQDGAIQF